MRKYELTCPHCRRKYMLEDEHIDPQLRTLQCPSCNKRLAELPVGSQFRLDSLDENDAR